MMQIRPTITENDVLLSNPYVSELQLSYIYERFFAIVPTEMDLGDFSLEVIDFIEKKNEYLFGKYSGENEDNNLKEFEEKLGLSAYLKSIQKYKTLYYITEKSRILIKLSAEKDKVNVSIAGENIKNLEKLAELISKFKEKKSNNDIGILCSGSDGRTYVKKVGIGKVELDVELNYGKEFLPVYNSILSKLKHKTHGLYNFHSNLPGTGKSTFIKYLAQNSERLFIFIPTNQLDILTSPSILTVLLEHPDSVLILEDAEKALLLRDENDNSSLVSLILNLTDGILGTLLKMALIVTFNTKLSNIDPAILRKGRLLCSHEFKPLSIENSQKLVDKLGKKFQVKEPMTVADIYYLDDDNFHKQKTVEKIGFAP